MKTKGEAELRKQPAKRGREGARVANAQYLVYKVILRARSEKVQMESQGGPGFGVRNAVETLVTE